MLPLSDFERVLSLDPLRGKTLKPTVVVIDDDDNVRSSLHLVLDDDYEVVACADATSGVAAVDGETQVVILDIKMQGRDGFWAYQAIRQKNELVPIIFHSAYQDLKDPFEIMNEYRPFGYLVKEGDLGSLLDTVKSAVRHYGTVTGIRRLQDDLKNLMGKNAE